MLIMSVYCTQCGKAYFQFYFPGMMLFYTKVISHLQKNLPLGNKVIQNASCLNPQNQKQWNSNQQIRDLAGQLPKISTEELASVSDEWRMYQCLDTSSFRHATRVDHYWRDVFKTKSTDGQKKFPVLEKVVKSILILPHGNADVERGFSVNRDVIGDDRPDLEMDALNGLRLSKEVLKMYDGKPEKVPLTRELINAVAVARTSYEARKEKEKLENERLEQEKKRKMEEEKKLQKERERAAEEKESLQRKEKRLEEKEDEVKDEYDLGKAILEDGQKELAKGIKAKDLALITKANVLIETGKTKMAEAEKQTKEIREKWKDIGERKSKLLDKVTRKVSPTSSKGKSSDIKNKPPSSERSGKGVSKIASEGQSSHLKNKPLTSEKNGKDQPDRKRKSTEKKGHSEKSKCHKK